ncbi:phosphatase PAP2 family protein [Dermacoccus nishinomiyaensis]|uniref:phosphatase PAP2 family protein n=1 Tax=Dermacoccus nishinomiyaensis TaxID=1274 RepID=UPI00093D902C|nr:phosphatase PAP2 family protein [Dermacoccus nishinomiyaensis]
MVARVTRDAVRSWGRRFVPAAFMMLLAAVVVGIVAMARDLPGGVSRARDGMHALSGTGRTFETIAACVGWVPRGALVVAVVAVVALPVSLLRRGGAWAVTPPRAASALLVIAGANLSTQAAKLLLARALTPEVATLPSGHATLALTSAAAVVLLAPPRWRRAALVGAGAWGTLGCLGVIAAYWHALGDVVAAIAVVAAWLGVAHLLLAPRGGGGGPHPFLGDLAIPDEGVDAEEAAGVRLGQRREGCTPAHPDGATVSRPASGGTLGAWPRPAPHDVLAAAAGAAWVVVTFLGWGTDVNAFGAWWVGAAVLELVAVPLGVTMIVASAARAVREVARTTH